MKYKLKILSALLLTALSAATIAQNHKNIEVTVDDDNGVVTKHVTVNGVELDEAGIAKLEADGDVKIIHLEGIDAQMGDTMTLAINNGHVSSDNIEVNINTDDGKVTKTVMMNGKKLSAKEIAELESSGKMNTFDLNSGDGQMMKKMIFIKTDDDDNSVDEQVKIIAKKLHYDSSNSATMGFMANIKDDGWHVISVIANSGAADAGMQAGDVITKMGDVDLTQSIEDVQEIIELTQWQIGEVVDVELIRDNQVQLVSVEARKNDSADFVMSNNNDNHMLMLNSSELSDLSKTISVMVSNNNQDFNFNEDDINMIFPDNLSDIKVFIAQGESTSDLLGKNHKLSTLSKGLSPYFKTQGGVLVLGIDQDNVFSLEEGDVIKSINGTEVKVPKDVIKALLKSENQQDIEIKIVRHKRNKTLKYNK
jgi:hypothetical protein